jgi:hypothetical protein
MNSLWLSFSFSLWSLLNCISLLVVLVVGFEVHN